jgi:NAD(P)-dependent dehydrogenase (short-subunit alcohol dehydrogenase family)
MPGNEHEQVSSELRDAGSDALDNTKVDGQRQRWDGKEITSSAAGPGGGTEGDGGQDHALDFLGSLKGKPLSDQCVRAEREMRPMLLQCSNWQKDRRSRLNKLAEPGPREVTRIERQVIGNVTDPIRKASTRQRRQVYEDLRNRPVLVTGAATGIGLAVAERFAEAGAVVGVNFLPGDECGPQSVGELTERGFSAFAVPADVTDREALDAAVREFTGVAGAPLVAISNAGIAQHIPFLSMAPEDWDRMIRVHLLGGRNVAAAVLPPMIKAGWGRLIFTASELAFVGAATLTHYCAAKGGLIAFAKALAREVGETGVTVNCVAPGPTETAMLTSYPDEFNDENRALIPLQRWGDPREVASTYLFLSSEGASWYTGQTLSPNGGAVM